MSPKECNAIEDETACIFDVPPVFKDKHEQETCEKIIDALTDEELEEAANTSYAYFMSNDKSNDYRNNMALKMTRRFLRAEKGNYEKALKRIQCSLIFRKESNVNQLRLAFHSDNSSEDNSTCESYQKQIISETSKQPMIIRGYDKENRAILLKYRRSDPSVDKESMKNTHLHILERAIACTEQASNGKQEKIVMILNYDDFSRANTPPMSLAKELISIFERNYPEQLAYLVFVEPPFLARTIWSIIKKFIDPDTVQKIKFVSGDDQKLQVMSPLIDKEQAVPWVIPGGELSPSFDMEKFLYQKPFHCDYEKAGCHEN